MTSRFTEFPSSTCTGPAYQQGSLPSWSWLSSCSLSQGAVTSGAGGSNNHEPVTLKCSAISRPAPDTMPAHLSRSNRELTQVLPLETSSALTPLSLTLPPVLPSSTLQSVVPSHLQPSNFPPLPPPAGSLDAPPSTATSLWPSINTNNPLPPPSSPSPMMSGHTREQSSFSTRAALRASTPSPADALRLVQSVKDYNLAGVAARDLRPGSVARLTVHF